MQPHAVETPRYRCPLCGRDKFDRDKQPHKCQGNFRKKLPTFQKIK